MSNSAVLPRASVALVSATALGYEVLLTRLFSIIQWHHFAYMVISIALLGFGASGTFLTLNPRLLKRYELVYVMNLILFGLSAPACFVLAQQFAINPEELLWNPGQMVRVTAVYLLLAIPFFFAANAIGLALMRYRRAVPRIYAADLVGAGFGSIGVIGLLYVLFPMSALKLLSVFGFAAAVIAAMELRFKRTAIASIAVALVAMLYVLPPSLMYLKVSPYKSLSQALNVIDTHVETERSSPLGVLSVVESPTIPLRHAPGLSLNATLEVPRQRGVFTDADAITPIDAAGERKDSAYLDLVTSALPYHLKPAHRPIHDVVVLGAGGGGLIRQALYHDVPAVTAVELNPQIVELLRQDYAEFSGGLYDLDQVNVYIEEARGFLAGNTNRYDLIQVALIDSFAASSAGLYALNENYLYTVEALEEYLAHLTEDGYLAITRWVKLPPRDALKLFATAVEALRRSGVDDPDVRLMMIRSWQTSTLIVKNGQLTEQEIDDAIRFSEARSFDLVYYPGMAESKANRFNILPEPLLYRGAQALLSEFPDVLLENYKFNITPATDDRPYFFYFFKWRTLPEILSLRGRGGVPLLESGYLILIATLLQAVVISVLLILLPVWKTVPHGSVNRRRVVVYFGALGLAFLFLEIAFIQRFLLFLHHPVLAIAVVLSGFLLFAGFGSACAGRWMLRYAPKKIVASAVATIAVLGFVYVFALPALVFEPLIGAPTAVKLAASVVLIAALAFPMGIPFPLGVARVGERSPTLIPWAWAINGCASVISAVLATVLAIHFGFTIVMVGAILLYLLAAAAFDF